MRPREMRRPARPDSTGQRRHRPDYILLLLSVVLLVIGLIVVYAISPGLAAQQNVSENYYVTKQLVTMLLGFIAFGVVSQIPIKFWRTAGIPLVVIAGLATVAALVMPTSPDYPAHRWIRLGGQSFQSVELIKF